MKQFFRQIYNKILKFDEYTNQYLKFSNNIEIPSLAYTNWGNHFANIKDFNTAIEKLETAVLMSDTNPKPCIALGTLYAKLREYEKAEEILNEAIKRDTQNPHTYSVLSSVYVAENKFDEAESFLRRAIKLSPSNWEIYFNYGILYAKMKKKYKAIEMLKKSKLLNPTNIHTYFILGVLLFETENIQEAFTEFKALEKLEPKYKNLNYYLALCYKKENNNMAVIEYGNRALENDPNNPSTYIMLAQIYLNLNKFNEVKAVFSKGEQYIKNDYEFYLAWGISLFKMNDTEEAKNKIYKALELNPENSAALNKLGNCFHKEKNIEIAEYYYKQAIEKNGSNCSALTDLGMIYYEKHNYDTALQTFFHVINISKDKTFLYFYIANCYYRMGKLKKSIEYYDKTVEYYPRHTEAYINYSLCLLEINNPKEALRKIRNAYQINRDSDKIVLIYALADLRTGIYSDAIEKADILLERNPDNEQAKLIKINTLINLKKPQEAIDIIQSLDEDKQGTDIYIYLLYLSYKILVEDNPSNYNENMLNKYLNKLNGIQIESDEINSYIIRAININK